MSVIQSVDVCLNVWDVDPVVRPQTPSDSLRVLDTLALPPKSLILMILSRLGRLVAGSARNVRDVCRAAEAHCPFMRRISRSSPVR